MADLFDPSTPDAEPSKLVDDASVPVFRHRPVIDLPTLRGERVASRRAELVRTTLRVPAGLARAAREERNDSGRTLTDVVMLAAAAAADDLLDEVHAAAKRLGGAPTKRRSGASGERLGIQWIGTQEELDALDELAASTGYRSRNQLATEVLHRRYGNRGAPL